MPSILVTGAGRGFGREVVRVYRERGWTVFPLVRQSADVEALTDPNGCHPICADVTEEKVEEAIANVLAARTDALDLLINNAGNIKKTRWLAETTTADMEALFRVHCVGAFRCVRAALPFLRKATNPLVVNISSRFGSISRMAQGEFRGIYAYSIAKSAQNMLTVCLDQELRREGIRVVSLHPGRLQTSVAAVDADTDPYVAAVKLAEWLQSMDREKERGLHDLLEDKTIAW